MLSWSQTVTVNVTHPSLLELCDYHTQMTNIDRIFAVLTDCEQREQASAVSLPWACSVRVIWSDVRIFPVYRSQSIAVERFLTVPKHSVRCRSDR